MAYKDLSDLRHLYNRDFGNSVKLTEKLGKSFGPHGGQASIPNGNNRVGTDVQGMMTSEP